eukprot:CAMPEP_0177621134 /NCGR_PEP_ID=MMETSP0419_2-20121207/27392_1 /TAXON_ID=582737 /ORGANISM="Tetraselmis sp., Strain GSL018" /LENGTH=395 /DNA_ID=CAMNT_0019120969 /DNA_START=464 /DNA_END=1648 /DNA_ORIENTATION=+
MIARELLAFMHLVLFSVTLVFVTSVVDSEDCACTRGLFPVCSSTTGKYVASSSDCAVKCAHDKTAVGCMFLRYYSWRRRCSCSMHLPQRSGGVCEASSGILLSKDASCAQCQKIPEEYKSCSSLAEDLKPLLPPPVYEVDTGNVSWYSLNSRGRPGGCVDSELCDVDLCGNLTCFEKNMYCNGSMDDLPACSMGTGALVAASGCQAAQLGHRYTMPCRFLAGRTSAPFFYSDDCLLGDGAPEFVGRVRITPSPHLLLLWTKAFPADGSGQLLAGIPPPPIPSIRFVRGPEEAERETLPSAHGFHRGPPALPPVSHPPLLATAFAGGAPRPAVQRRRPVPGRWSGAHPSVTTVQTARRAEAPKRGMGLAGRGFSKAVRPHAAVPLSTRHWRGFRPP